MVRGALKNILIPVGFSKINTAAVLEKVITLIEPVDSIIHIFHVINKSSQPGYEEAAREKLDELRHALIKRLRSISISIDLVRGENVQQEIVEKASQLNAEMIVIIKNRSHKWFRFNKAVNATLIAKETDAAILLVNPEAIPNKIRSIVLPVRSFMPERNIELLSALTGNHKPLIHLVTTPDKNERDSKTNIFISTYRTLSDFLHYPVEYKVLRARHFSRIVLGYGKNIMADLVFMNPFDETKKNLNYHTDISDMISPDSRQCVLIVKSFNYITQE